MIRALCAQVYTGFYCMKVSTLRALSPADGRYADKVNSLRDIFSEYGLIRYRVLVEVRWLQWLADEQAIEELGPLSSVMKDILNSIVDDFSLDDAVPSTDEAGRPALRYRDVLDNAFGMSLGETVVVGTSQAMVDAGDSLIVLLAAGD